MKTKSITNKSQITNRSRKILNKGWIAVLALAITGTLLMQGCKKSVTNKLTNSNNNLAKISYPINKIEVIGNMFRFTSFEHVNEVLNILENQNDVYDDKFVAKYSGLSLEQFDSLETAINYNDEYTLDSFEENFTFQSLRKKLRQEEENWLENNGENVNEDPDNHFIIDEVERAILNPKCQIIVADTIYMLTEESWIEVYNFDFETLKDIENGVIDVDQIKTGKNWAAAPRFPFFPNCEDAKRNISRWDYEYDGNKRIKWIVGIWNHPWQSRAVAKVKGYKKRRNRWKKYRSELWVNVHGIVRDDKGNPAPCTPIYVDISEPGIWTGATAIPTKKKRKLKAKAVINQVVSTKKHELMGGHYGAGGIIKNSVLKW